jgi:hypothetical protein
VHFLQHHDDVRKNIFVYYETHSTFHPPIISRYIPKKSTSSSACTSKPSHQSKDLYMAHFFRARNSNKNSKIHPKKKSFKERTLAVDGKQ